MPKILAVDDDPKILEAYLATLTRKGYEVFTTTEPEDAAKLLEERDIDLIMLDIRMPKKSGFDIFQEVKKKFSQLPVLFVTAYPKSFALNRSETLEMWTKDFADGNTDILYKPFELEVLYEKVEGLIGAPGENAV